MPHLLPTRPAFKQASQQAAELQAAREEASGLASKVQALKEELAASHATRANDIKSNVAILQVGAGTPGVRWLL